MLRWVITTWLTFIMISMTHPRSITFHFIAYLRQYRMQIFAKWYIVRCPKHRYAYILICIVANVEWFASNSDISFLLPCAPSVCPDIEALTIISDRFVISHHDPSTSSYWPPIRKEGIEALPVLLKAHEEYVYHVLGTVHDYLTLFFQLLAVCAIWSID